MEKKSILVFGATGNIGGALTRNLLSRGWIVHAVTRNPNSDKAKILSSLGANIVQADMDDPQSLKPVFKGIKRVFSLQNWTTSGIEGEIMQGKFVADAAKEAEVEHLVFASAGTGDPDTGVPHFNSKLEVEAYMRTLQLPFTIVRPAPFMELLTEKAFFPALAAWGAQIKILGWDTPIPWVAAEDIGVVISKIFKDPDSWIGKDLQLFGDIKTMRECQRIFQEIDGKNPSRLSLPLWLFNKMAGEEMVIMWRWLNKMIREGKADELFKPLQETQKIYPQVSDLKTWLTTKRKTHQRLDTIQAM